MVHPCSHTKERYGAFESIPYGMAAAGRSDQWDLGDKFMALLKQKELLRSD